MAASRSRQRVSTSGAWQGKPVVLTNGAAVYTEKSQAKFDAGLLAFTLED